MCLENGEDFDLEKDTELAYEAQKYKCMYDKAYEQHLFFFFSKNLFYPKPKFPLFRFFSIFLEVLIVVFKESIS